jgi:transcriptional regulator with XRE-family HTH domain
MYGLHLYDSGPQAALMRQQYKPEKVYKSIGLKVRKLRESREWTLEDMEGHGELSWQQLQKIESGRNITIRTLIRLSNTFGVHPTHLLEDI